MCLSRDVGYKIEYGAFAPLQDHSEELEVEQGLRRAIHAFAARWLPVLACNQSDDTTAREAFARDAWRSAGSYMLRVVNRLCYRSVLTLHLFGQTPVPAGISKEEEPAALNAAVCSQTAFLQVQQLRDRVRPMVRTAAAQNPVILERFINLETRAYWLATMWDTAGAMSLSVRSAMTSGLKGACSEPTWRLVRSYLVGLPHQFDKLSGKTDRQSQTLLSSQILAGANVSRLYLWKNITSINEALREGVEEADLQQSWTSLPDAMEIWRAVVDSRLKGLGAHLPALAPSDQLCWFDANLRRSLGLLKLSKTLEENGRADLALQLAPAGHEARQGAFNILRYGLVTTFDAFTMDQCSVADSPRLTANTSVIAIYPHPELVVSLVQLLRADVGSDRHHILTPADDDWPKDLIFHRVLKELPVSPAVCAMQESLPCPPRFKPG